MSPSTLRELYYGADFFCIFDDLLRFFIEEQNQSTDPLDRFLFIEAWLEKQTSAGRQLMKPEHLEAARLLTDESIQDHSEHKIFLEIHANPCRKVRYDVNLLN